MRAPSTIRSVQRRRSVQLSARIKSGMRVRYWPIAGKPEYVDTVTRSDPWQLGHGEWVVLVEGRAGGVALSHLMILEEAPR